jgi:hypothetical protein
MKISGFSFVKNGAKLYYPIIEAIQSILPICDEFIVAVGKGDEDDNTREQIEAIGDPKIQIIDTVWNEKYFKKGIINAYQTDIAMKACSGDWLFYLQSDEVVHEKYLPVIKERCEELLNDEEIEGLLFKYKHFWGDYTHYQDGHGWYPNEIRIVRNREYIHSWQSAQSFRNFDTYFNPRQPEGTRKLIVAKVNAEIFHYGWVRPPHLMQSKKKALDSVHWGLKKAEDVYDNASEEFDYGPLDRLAFYNDTHPKVMEGRIKSLDWEEKLQYSGSPNPNRKLHKHEQLKYRFLSFLEKHFTRGKQIAGFRNYILSKK